MSDEVEVTESDRKIRRLRVSESGETTEYDVWLSSMRRDAIDLGAADPTAMAFLVTREAAVRITEQALSRAIEKSWTQLILEKGMEKKIDDLSTANKPTEQLPSPPEAMPPSNHKREKKAKVVPEGSKKNSIGDVSKFM